MKYWAPVSITVSTATIIVVLLLWRIEDRLRVQQQSLESELLRLRVEAERVFHPCVGQ